MSLSCFLTTIVKRIDSVWLQFWMQVLKTFSSRPCALFFVAKATQDASTNRDREFAENLDGMLQDPDFDIRWNVPIEYTGSSPEPATTYQPPNASSASA